MVQPKAHNKSHKHVGNGGKIVHYNWFSKRGWICRSSFNKV